jgi:hypothetical protein
VSSRSCLERNERRCALALDFAEDLCSALLNNVIDSVIDSSNRVAQPSA